MILDPELVIHVSAECPMCEQDNKPLGRLGTHLHYSCRACGVTYSRILDNEEYAAVREMEAIANESDED